jgi:glycosyltransferase involved in cell wall biosynthesis
LKILFVLGRYLPEKKGGIENYTHQIAKLLLQNGFIVDVTILHSNRMQPYFYEGLNVIPLRKGLSGFTELIRKNHFDACHFQEYSGESGIHLEWFRIAKLYCKKVFFTFHLPYLTCYKNDFRYYGIEDCNTFNSATRCLKCIIATKLNYQKAARFTLHNLGIQLLAPALVKAGLMKNLKNRVHGRQDDLRKLLAICDKVFLIANWFKELLVENGYGSSSLVSIPPVNRISFNSQAMICNDLKKRILFVGRIEHQKGLLLLCKAMNLVSNDEVQLDVFGNKVDPVYFTDCMKEYAFNYGETLGHHELLKLFPEYDFLILPSLFTEMYPLVIQEALSAHLPVIASAAKGNIDIIKEGKSGFIFEYNNYKDLARVIDKSYSLKENGWQPEFETIAPSKRDTKEILSYYEIDPKALHT